MTPDTIDSRVRHLEDRTARLEQSRDDQRDRLVERFREFDNDVRAFAPMLEDVIELKKDFKHFQAALTEHKADLKAFSSRLDAEKTEREKRQKEERSAKWVRIGTAIAIFGTFVSSTTAVLALLLG